MAKILPRHEMRSSLMLLACISIASVACSGDSGTCTCQCLGDACDEPGPYTPTDWVQGQSSLEDCQDKKLVEFDIEFYGVDYACAYSPSASINAPRFSVSYAP